MKGYVLVSAGLESLAQKEVKELLKLKTKVTLGLVEFELNKPREILTLLYRGQSWRRVLIGLGDAKTVEEMEFTTTFPWQEFLPAQFSFKIEVDNVKGQENRFDFAKIIAGKLFSLLEKELQFNPTLELKNPEFIFLLYFDGERYYLGLDVAGKELSSRSYRVFTNSASYKGDFGYYFVRTSGFKAGEKLLLGFVKDGTIAIEAALFAYALSVQDLSMSFSYRRFPCFKDVTPHTLFEGWEKKAKKTTNIVGFDESLPSILAANKNSSIAKTKELLFLRKYALDELDVKFSQHEFDRAIFYITTKDEPKLNEILYQSAYVLKSQGTLLLISQKKMILGTSDRFVLEKEEEIQRGDNVYHLWILKAR